MHLLGVDQVIVVQDQQHPAVARRGSQLVDQRRHQPRKRCWCRRGPAARPPARRCPAAPGPAPQPRAAKTVPGSSSPSSSDNQATGRSPRRAQSASSAVLPNPAGAPTRISRRASPSSSACTSRGRGTKPSCKRGTCPLVAEEHIPLGEQRPRQGPPQGAERSATYRSARPAMASVAAGSVSLPTATPNAVLTSPSKSQVTELSKSLDAAVEQFRSRPLD